MYLRKSVNRCFSLDIINCGIWYSTVHHIAAELSQSRVTDARDLVWRGFWNETLIQGDSVEKVFGELWISYDGFDVKVFQSSV